MRPSLHSFVHNWRPQNHVEFQFQSRPPGPSSIVSTFIISVVAQLQHLHTIPNPSFSASCRILVPPAAVRSWLDRTYLHHQHRSPISAFPSATCIISLFGHNRAVVTFRDRVLVGSPPPLLSVSLTSPYVSRKRLGGVSLDFFCHAFTYDSDGQFNVV